MAVAASLHRLRLLVWPILVALALVASGAPARASVDLQDSFAAVRASRPPHFDGTLSDPEWRQGIVATGFVSMTTRRSAPMESTAYLLYDDRYIYAAFTVGQSAARITANQTTNNIGLGLDDWVAIGIDPSGNGSRIYYFYTTPRGVRYQKSTESVRYNPAWESHAAVAGSSWVAEIVIPIRDMRTPSTRVQTWRFSFARFVAATNDQYTWAYDPRMGDPGDSRWYPSLTDIRLSPAAVRPKAYADIYGLTSVGRDRKIFQQSNGTFASTAVRNYGVDATYPISGSMAFVGTLSPDFSNVETDQQIIAPQEFQRQLTEYRPFFSQGADFLTPGLHDGPNGSRFALLFYSPNIGEFNRGLKVEGTARLNAIGALESQGPGFDDIAFGINHLSPAQDLRYFVDGVLANHSGGRDVTYQFGGRKTNNVSGWESGGEFGGESGTFVPDASQAHYLTVYTSLNKPHYSAGLTYHDLGPYFAPLDGFVQLDDVRGPAAFFSAFGSGAGGSKLKSYFTNLSAERYLERSGNVHEESSFGNIGVVFKNLLGVTINDSIGTFRTYPGTPLNGYPSYAGGLTLPFDQTSMQLGYRDGTDAPLDASLSWGPFATLCPSGPPEQSFCLGHESNFVHTYVQQLTSSTSRSLSPRLSLGLEYDGTIERPFFPALADSQFLRRISLGESLGEDSNVSVAWRSISGSGGFALPGRNIAVSYHKRFVGGSELFVAYGTPAAIRTIDRLIVKYVLHLGGAAGT